MILNIEKLNYHIKHHEFSKINHQEYNHLKLYNDIGLFERIIGLIKKLKKCFDKDENLLHSPFEAVNHFLKAFEGNYKILHISYRIFLEKI
jgi:hypothetical protein